MTAEADTSVTFLIGESGDVEWLYRKTAPDLTPEQAMVIVRARGMARMAEAYERLAAAIETLADKLKP